MSGEPPTLADLALREALRFGKKGHRYVASSLCSALSSARRFVLDEAASRFLADLAFANMDPQASPPALQRAMEASRVLARLPHKDCWFEYSAPAAFQRLLELYPGKLKGEKAGLSRAGWWLHQLAETTFRATIIQEAEEEGPVLQLPLDIVWTTDNSVPPPATGKPLQCGEKFAAHHFEGASDYKSTHVCLAANAIGATWDDSVRHRDSVKGILNQLGYELRSILTLLSTINDIPLGVREVKQSRGFVAQGRYRKFLDHTVVTINLPKGRDPHKVARSIIAIARRRAHQVRGHWRRDWRHEGNRIWIKEHQRGDATLGFVTHDYRVEHRTEEGAQP